MKVIYAEPILNRIYAAKDKAALEHRTIEKILVTRDEFNELCAAASQWMWQPAPTGPSYRVDGVLLELVE